MLSVINTLETSGCTFDLPSLESVVFRVHTCREERDLFNARSLHLQMCHYGLESTLALGNHVVPMFVDCGSLLEAQKVFQQMVNHTEHSWTSLIQGFHEDGEWEHGFNLYQEMLHNNVNPSSFTFSVLLKACAKMNSVERGQELHSELTKKGFETSMSVGNTLVDMYAKCGLLMDAQDTFNVLPCRDTFSWTALASGYVELGFAQETSTCFEKMQEEGIPHNTVSCLCNVKACGMLGNLDKGYLIHTEIVINSFESMTFVGSALVGMYVKLGLLAQAQDVFDEMSVRDSVLWNLLFMGYAEHRYDEVTIKCWEQMISEGVTPDAAVYVTMIKACGSIGATDRGLKIHAECVCKGYESDPYVISMLIDMYMKFALFSEAQQVFDQSPMQDVVLWTGLIAGYAEHGLGEQALGCFKGMCCNDILPNSITFSCTLKACASGRFKNEGQEIHIQAVMMGLESDSLVSGTLIDFYVRLGLFSDAEELFDRLPSQDTVSWNILIAGYVEHGVCEEGLKCFKRMQHKGIPGTALTFVSSLKACGGIGDVEAGQEVHISIVKQGLEKDRLIGNILVDMYARCGSLVEEAEDEFKRLDSRDVISWTALIQGYSDNDMGFKAIKHFKLMQEEEICPDVVTYSCILQACGSIRATERGQLMHTDTVIRGFDGTSLAENALVDMYTKLGLYAEAWSVFSMVLDPDVGTWNKLIQGYSEQGLGEEAMALLEQMQLEGLSPDVYTWNTVMVGYVEHDNAERVFELYAQMQEQGVPPNDFTLINMMASCGNTSALQYGRRVHAQIITSNSSVSTENLAVSLIDMYGKCGSMVDAHHVFDVMPKRDIAAWNALISGYTRQGNNKLVFYLYDSMKEQGFAPNEITCLSLMSACQHAGLVETGRDCFEFMSRELGIEPTMKHYACTFDLLGRAGRLNEIVTLMQEMPFRPNLVAWHPPLICDAPGHGQQALDCFEQMQCEGILPDAVTYVCLLKACAVMKDIDRGKQIHDEILSRGFLKHEIVLGGALVDMYAKCGALSQALSVLEKLPSRNIVAWNSLIAGHVQNGQGQQALDYFKKMQHEGIPPDAVTYACILKSCAMISAIDKGIQIHKEISKQGLLEHDIVLGGALVDMYAKCGALAQAQSVLEKLPSRDVVSWSALIAGYAQEGQDERALKCFEQMQCDGIFPDKVTFLCLLNLCGHLGLVEKGQELFDSMGSTYGLKPDIECFTCLVDLLGRAGNLVKAVEVIQEMPISTDSGIWHCLLGACREWVDVNVGVWAFERAVELDKCDGAAYVLMVNIYAAAGMVEEAKVIEALRIKNKAWKQPGFSSWTDSNNTVHKFCVNDTKHAQSKEIDLKFDDVDLKMSQEGYCPTLKSVS